jgi:hypothetical protein
MCPHTTTNVSSYCDICVLILYVLILLHMSAYYYICDLILLYMRPHISMSPHTTMCPHTTTYVSSHYYIFVLILLYMCPHTTSIYVS